jgi:hypothetical protein
MTDAQKKFVSLEKQKEQVKKFFEELSEAVAAVQKEVGTNGYFQDEEGTVYKIVEPDGKYVPFEKLSYLRTRRLVEERSPLPLALKEAEAAGFNVPKK